MIGVFLCLFVGMLVAMLTRGASGAKSPATVRQIIVSAVCFQGASIALVWRFVREHGISWSEAFGLRNAWARAVALGAIVTLIFLPLGSVLQYLSFTAIEYLGIKPIAQEAVLALRNASQGPALMVFVLVTVVVAPLGEELLFRGVLYPALKRAGFPRLALWGSSILFAAIHFNLSIFLPLLLLSLLLVWLYEYTDNFIAPLTAHVFFNSANLVIYFVNTDTAAKFSAPQ